MEKSKRIRTEYKIIREEMKDAEYDGYATIHLKSSN